MIKKLLKNKNKSWSRLIEYHPTISTIHGLPKTHKPNIPIRFIVSGINSALHKLARTIIRILTIFLGTISTTHIKYSGDLLRRIWNINMTNRSMASLGIKSLYINMSIMKYLNILRNHLKKSKVKLPLPVYNFIKICKLITNHCYFSFNNIFYKQKFGLPMMSSISCFLA